MSGVKLHILFMASEHGQSIQIGRDRFYEIMRENSLVLRMRKRRRPGKQHPACIEMKNLTKGLDVLGPNHLVACDDTQVKCQQGKGHLALVTDVHSHMVTGYSWSRRANSAHARRALKMSLPLQKGEVMAMIHHSDRGSIYISNLYLKLLGKNHIRASFSPQCNPVAERINGIIKQEYLCNSLQMSFEQIARELALIIHHYNEIRPHMSCDMNTPGMVHRLECKPAQRWKGRKHPYPKKEPSVV